MRIEDENYSIRINQYGLRKFLGDLEFEIMEVIWNGGRPSITVREVYEAVRSQRQIAYTTVMTTMKRLAEKEILIIIDKVGLSELYAPSSSQSEMTELWIKHVVRVLVTDFPEAAFKALSNYE